MQAQNFSGGGGEAQPFPKGTALPLALSGTYKFNTAGNAVGLPADDACTVSCSSCMWHFSNASSMCGTAAHTASTILEVSLQNLVSDFHDL